VNLLDRAASGKLVAPNSSRTRRRVMWFCSSLRNSSANWSHRAKLLVTFDHTAAMCVYPSDIVREEIGYRFLSWAPSLSNPDQ
jgi:hypothetical protein